MIAKGVLFDMDGILLDTERVSRDYFIEANQRRGYSMSVDFFSNLLGITQDEGRRVCEKEYGMAYPYEAVWTEAHDRLLRDAAAGGLIPKDGLDVCLSALKACGARLALVSSSARKLVTAYIASTVPLQNRFDVLVCGMESGKSKPAPDAYLHAAALLGLQPAECIGVEDSFAGVQSVRAAGCYSVMIPDLVPYSDMFAPFVDDLLPSLNELPALVRKRAQ